MTSFQMMGLALARVSLWATGSQCWAAIVPSIPAIYERRLLILSEPADQSQSPISPGDKWLVWTPSRRNVLL